MKAIPSLPVITRRPSALNARMWELLAFEVERGLTPAESLELDLLMRGGGKWQD